MTTPQQRQRLARPRRGGSEAIANVPLFSRGGFTNPFGKMSLAPIKNLRLPMEVEERLQRQAAEIRLPFHEYLREVLTVRAMGADVVKATYAQRVDAIAGNEEETNSGE